VPASLDGVDGNPQSCLLAHHFGHDVRRPLVQLEWAERVHVWHGIFLWGLSILDSRLAIDKQQMVMSSERWSYIPFSHEAVPRGARYASASISTDSCGFPGFL
jgi:hypothetical protein